MITDLTDVYLGMGLGIAMVTLTWSMLRSHWPWERRMKGTQPLRIKGTQLLTRRVKDCVPLIRAPLIRAPLIHKMAWREERRYNDDWIDFQAAVFISTSMGERLGITFEMFLECPTRYLLQASENKRLGNTKPALSPL
ncbi:MAG: hypothetical protein R8M38_01670 [Mariprofundaceae bacterium]